MFQEDNHWNHHDNQTGYMGFPNYFETQSPTPITDNISMNATNSAHQYSLPTESMDFISNRSTNLEDTEILPLINNESTTPGLSEKLANQYLCKNGDCNKTYATVSGLNNHIKK